MAPPLALIFGEVLLGGILIDHGVKDVKAALPGGSDDNTSDASSTAPGGAQPPAAIQAEVEKLSSEHGWGEADVQDWLNVIGAEDSTGNLTIQNPSSGAYGIAQFIDGPSEYAQYGGNADSLSGELTAMANYIQQRYETPVAAWAHEQEYHWY